MSNDYFKKIKKLIMEKTGMDAEEIHETSYFQDDLNLDDLELIEFLTELEDEHHIELINRKDEIETVQDLLDIMIEELE